MENKKWFLPTIITIGVLLLAFVAYKLWHRSQGNSVNEYPPIGNNMPCPGETKTLTMEDPYMQGMLQRGQKYQATFNYYACNPLKRGDIVLHRLSSKTDPSVKIVRGIPGDHFALSRDKEFNAWNVSINGDMVKSSDGRKYFFGAPTPPPMALYEKNTKGVLQDGDIIILSALAPGDRDSGIFGVMSVKDVVAKVELLEQEKSPESEPATPTPAPTVAATKPVQKAPAINKAGVKTKPAVKATPKK